MENKINTFKQIEESLKANLDEILKISEIGSSIDTRYPEDAKPIYSLDIPKMQSQFIH